MKLRKKLDCILLVDDDDDDNLFHKIILDEMDIVENVDVAVNGIEALKYLTDDSRTSPDIIFLDINMPRMNGWEFLEKYKGIDEKQKARSLIMMLTTSTNPEDIARANKIKEVTGIETKPLSIELMEEILREHFKDYL